MKPWQQLIENHTNEDGDVDLAAALEEMKEALAAAATTPITAEQTLILLDQHQDWALRMLGSLVLQTAEQAGVLDGDYPEAVDNLLLALRFDKFRRLYQLRLGESSIVIPGQTTINEVLGEA